VAVHRLKINDIWRNFSNQACIGHQDFLRYFHGIDEGFAIQLGSVGKFDRPIKAVDLREEYGVYPPQSYRYVDDLQLELFAIENVQVSH
jgi:predicted transcriptional regulator